MSLSLSLVSGGTGQDKAEASRRVLERIVVGTVWREGAASGALYGCAAGSLCNRCIPGCVP